MKKILLLLAFFLVPASVLAGGPEPWITARFTNDGIRIKNRGHCPLYRVEIYSVPPDRGDLSSVWSRLVAETVGAGSYSYKIGTIQEDGERYIPISNLVNSSGERLNLDTVSVGKFVLNVSYCGYTHSASWER